MNKLNDTFFLLKPIRIKPRTEESIKKGFELYKAKYGENRTLEVYINSLKNWNDYEFEYSDEYLSFFLNKEEAIECALSNVADYNDGGVYNFSAVVEYYIGASYFETMPISIKIFKYIYEKELYEEIDIDSCEESNLILKKHYIK